MGKGKIETERFVPVRLRGGLWHNRWVEFNPNQWPAGSPRSFLTPQGEYMRRVVDHPDHGRIDVYCEDGVLRGQPPVVIHQLHGEILQAQGGIPVTLKHGRFDQFDVLIPTNLMRAYASIEVHRLMDYPEEHPAVYMSCWIQSADKGRHIQFWDYQYLSHWLPPED